MKIPIFAKNFKTPILSGINLRFLSTIGVHYESFT